jgi:hypothetical protein
MTDTVTEAGIRAAVTRLRLARELHEALTPLDHLLAEADEEMRAAVLSAADAGLSERAIAGQAQISQPEVHRQLDGRRGDVLPAPTVAERLWMLHRVTAAVHTQVLRLTGHAGVAGKSPSSSHQAPTDAVRLATGELGAAAGHLARAAAAQDLTDTQQ